MDKILENKAKIKQRILEFIESQGITKVEFCKKTGIGYPNLKGKSHNSELGGDSISKILETFPQISPYWLLLGKGEMTAKNCDKNLDDLVKNNRTSDRDLHCHPHFINSFDTIIKEKDKQIFEKDRQIDRLLHIIETKLPNHD